LDFFSSKVQSAELAKDIVAYLLGTAAARIVGKPPAIASPDQVEGDD
jgi:hypothetical protein